MVKALNMDNFSNEVIACNGRVLVDFWAEWCGPCRMLSPLVDEVAEECPDVKVCKVDCDEARDLALEFGINAIPALLYFVNGEEKDRSIGLVEKQDLLDMING